MAGNDTSAMFAGLTGAVKVAPVGSTAPTSPFPVWDSAWIDIGIVDQNGVTLTPAQNTSDVTGWQYQYPVRRLQQARSLQAQFTIKQWSGTTLPLLFGGGSVATVPRVTWTATHGYSLNDTVEPVSSNGRYYRATTAGTTGSSSPTFPTTNGATVTDGTVVWTDQGAGTNAVYTFTPPSAGVVDERALGFEFVDGGNIIRWVIKRGMVSSTGGIKFARSQTADCQITFELFGPTDNSVPFVGPISNLTSIGAA